jgi:ubiquinone/menaquinone biosynthesis C-methylase UbiE
VTVAVGVTLATGLFAGRFLESYDATIWFELEADRIAKVLEVEEGDGIGDVRAGTGRWSVDLARRVGPEGQVYATAGPTPAHILFQGISDSGVNNVSVITRTPGDSGRLPLNCCDGILLRHVYRNFADRTRLAASLSGYAKIGGRVAVIEFLDSGQTSPGLTTNRVSPVEMIEEFSASGFELIELIDDWSANTYCAVFRRTNTPPVGPVGDPNVAPASN